MNEEVGGRITGLEVPDDGVMIGEIAIVTWIDGEGQQLFGVTLNGNMAQTQIVGLLEMVKLSYAVQ